MLSAGNIWNRLDYAIKSDVVVGGKFFFLEIDDEKKNAHKFALEDK